jgi:NAD(P)-dependent dehydrogenase (short-subunit alcohol dehydrogenase family)
MSDVRFDGRVALVTGAGGGIGRCHALLLARRGAKVVVNDLGAPATDGKGAGPSMADQVVREIEAEGGVAVANYDSVSSPEGGNAMVEAALKTYGRLDILVNNAGILRDRSFTKLPTQDIQDVLDVHLRGGFYVSQPAFRAMREAAFGRIVFTASASGLFGNFGQSNYGAAKMGLVGLSNVLGLEGAKYNITSNVIAPIARTRMTANLLGPMVETLDPEFVSPLVAWLCSQACDDTQQIYSVGGGRIAKVAVQVNRGWYGGASPMTIEAVRDNMTTIRDMSDAMECRSIADETALLAQMLK